MTEGQNNKMLKEVIENIRRGTPSSLDTFLKTIVKEDILSGTKAQFYAHLIELDGNGNVRLDDFISFITHHIIAYVIPRSRIQEAKEKDDKEGLDRHKVRLYEEAKKLFTPLRRSGEGGEMLLFILGEVLLGLPQLFCKMSVKTSGAMHYHGADGVHAGINEDGNLELFWGESKLHKKFSGGLNDCIKSISPFLQRDRDADHADLLLLQSHLDLSDKKYTDLLKTILDKDNSAFNSVRYCGLCFVGFDEDLYSATTTTEIINSNCESWKTAVQSKLSASGLADFKIHFFCLPVQSVEDFRKRFLLKLGIQ